MFMAAVVILKCSNPVFMLIVSLEGRKNTYFRPKEKDLGLTFR